MSSRLKVTKGYMTSAERLSVAMAERLQKSAGQELKAKLESGEVKIINGKYVGAALTVTRPKKTRIKPKFAVIE